MGISVSYPPLIDRRMRTAPNAVMPSAFRIQEYAAKLPSRTGYRLVTDVCRRYLSPSNRLLADVPHKRDMYLHGLDPKRWLRCTNHLDRGRNTCGFLWNDTAKYAFQTTSWPRCRLKAVSLRIPHRHEGDEGWFDMLSEIRRGIVSPTTLEYLKTLDRAPNVSNSGSIKPLLLHTRRNGVASHNEEELVQLPGRSHDYVALNVIRGPATKYSGMLRQSNPYYPVDSG